MPDAPSHEELIRSLEAATRPAPPRDPAAEPLVTVAMPARNAAAYIDQALDSVLGQDGVALEVVVVDDGSTDETAERVEARGDPRVRLHRNGTRRGIGACHNLVVALARAPYVAHVDADDVVLPGGLAALLQPLLAQPEVAQTYCDFFEIEDDGSLGEAAYRAQLGRFARRASAGIDYRRELLVHGMVANHLRTYRKSAVVEVGGFDESLEHGEDWAMAVALADRWELRRVPGFHYCRRLHATNTSVGAGFTPLRYWRGHVRVARRMSAERGGVLLGRGRLRVMALLGLGLLHASGAAGAAKLLVRRAQSG